MSLYSVLMVDEIGDIYDKKKQQHLNVIKSITIVFSKEYHQTNKETIIVKNSNLG